VTIGASGNHLKIIQKTQEHTEKAPNQASTHNSHIDHCTHTRTSKSTDVKLKNFTKGNKITRTTHCNYRTAAKTNTLETSLVLGIQLQIPCTKVTVNNNNNNNNNNKGYTTCLCGCICENGMYLG
jgi:hypothetical protein